MTFRNAWVVSVDGARRRLPGFAALAIAILVLVVSLVGGAAIYRVLPSPAATAATPAYSWLLLDRVLQNLCIIGPLYIAALMVGTGWEGRARRRPHLAGLASGGIGASAGVGLFLLALGLAALAGGVQRGASSLDFGQRAAGVVLGAVIVLFQAAGEEVFFRGWLQPVLAARWGPWIGLVTTSLLFAAAHAALQPLGVLAFVNDLLAGTAFGLLALRTSGLAAAIAAHWGWNWAEQSLAGATPNPGVDPLGSLFDLDLRGPGLVSGGADEMNGSLCATVALALMIAIALLLRFRDQAASPL